MSKRFFTPVVATIAFGAASIVWYVALTILSPDDFLKDSLLALGFMIAFYYGLTGFVCVVYYRKHIFTSMRNFLLVGAIALTLEPA